MYPQLSLNQLSPDAQNLVRNSSDPDLTLKLISRQVALAESLQAWQSQLGKPIVWNYRSKPAPLLKLGDKIEWDGCIGTVVTVYHRVGLDYTGFSYYVDVNLGDYITTVEVFESSLAHKVCAIP